jgi:hypothetical protein
MSTLDFDVSNLEGFLFLFFGLMVALVRKVFKPIWKKFMVSQVLLSHSRLAELREKECLSDREKDEFVEIVKDSLEI